MAVQQQVLPGHSPLLHAQCSMCLSSVQVSGGDVAQLEQLLPQVAYGNIMAEDAATLTCRHFRQLLALGQACLDYLWAICMATSRVMVSMLSSAVHQTASWLWPTATAVKKLGLLHRIAP